MADNEELNLQQNLNETAFKTEQTVIGDMFKKADDAFAQSEQKEQQSEKRSLESRLEKEDIAVSYKEIQTTEKAAAQDPDDDKIQYNKDFQKTDIAFNKLSKEPPLNPKAVIKASSVLLDN